MESQLVSIWNQSRAFYAALLTDQERLRLETVGDQERLLDLVHDLKKRYESKIVVTSLRRIQVFVVQLKSFSRVINIFVQSDPKVAALVWGPVALIIEVDLWLFSDAISSNTHVQLALKHQSTLGRITDILESLERCLPRYQDYLETFGTREPSKRLKDALVKYYLC